MNEITELINDPLVQQAFYIIGIIGILFIGFCFVVTVGDELFKLYEYLQSKYYNRLKVQEENKGDKKR